MTISIPLPLHLLELDGLPLIQRHTRRDDARPDTGNDPAGDDHGECIRPKCGGLKALAESHDSHAD